MALSNKRRTNAILLGEAMARNFLTGYAKHGLNFFPKGLESLADIAGDMAAVHLPLSCTWEVTEQEKTLAHDAAVTLINIAFEVAKLYKNGEKGS